MRVNPDGGPSESTDIGGNWNQDPNDTGIVLVWVRFEDIITLSARDEGVWFPVSAGMTTEQVRDQMITRWESTSTPNTSIVAVGETGFRITVVGRNPTLKVYDSAGNEQDVSPGGGTIEVVEGLRIQRVTP